MVSSANTQSLTNFRLKAAETLDRVNQTGEAEIITVNGEARGVLLSPATYDQMAKDAQLTRDLNLLGQSMKQHKNGIARPADEFFDELRKNLLTIKGTRNKGKLK